MSNDAPRRSRFSIVSADSFARALTSRLVPCADAVRNLNTTLGVYNYSVWLVFTSWSGGERNEGVEELAREEPVLPTPCVGALTALEETIQSIGRDEVGSLTVTQISMNATSVPTFVVSPRKSRLVKPAKPAAMTPTTIVLRIGVCVFWFTLANTLGSRPSRAMV